MSTPDKQRIVDLHKDGHSNGEIAGRIGRSVSVVQRIVAQYKSTGAKPVDHANLSEAGPAHGSVVM